MLFVQYFFDKIFKRLIPINLNNSLVYYLSCIEILINKMYSTPSEYYTLSVNSGIKLCPFVSLLFLEPGYGLIEGGFYSHASSIELVVNLVFTTTFKNMLNA